MSLLVASTRLLSALATVALVAGCMTPGTIAPAPGVNFTAHRVSSGLAIDRLPDGRSGTLGSSGRWRGPQWVLEQKGTAAAAIWSAPTDFTVRRSTSESSALVGHVNAAWTKGAIALTFHPAWGAPVTSTLFNRLGTRAPEVLRTYAKTQLDVRGAYRATLYDAAQNDVGWLRVRVSPYQDAPRIYDGNIPSSLDGALVAAAAQMLDREVDYIENHAAEDVYQGLHSSSGRGR